MAVMIENGTADQSGRSNRERCTAHGMARFLFGKAQFTMVTGSNCQSCACMKYIKRYNKTWIQRDIPSNSPKNKLDPLDVCIDACKAAAAV